MIGRALMSGLFVWSLNSNLLKEVKKYISKLFATQGIVVFIWKLMCNL